MIYAKGFLGQEMQYAVSSSSPRRNMQVVCVHMRERDQAPAHFWKTFTGALAVWDVRFSQMQRQRSFPEGARELGGFLQEFAAETRDNPLLLLFLNMNRLIGDKVQDFLQKLVELKLPELLVIVLHSESTLFVGEADPRAELLAERCRYLPAQEERDYYCARGDTLTEEEFCQAREFTDGWLPAVGMLENLLQAQNRALVFEDFDTVLMELVENQYYCQYTRREQQFLVALSFLEDFPFGLVRAFSDWDGEKLEAVFYTSPLLRYDRRTKRFRYAAFLQPHLQALQHQLDEVYRQSFYERAADWYREQGLRVDAVRLYTRAGAWEKILKVVQHWDSPGTREIALCYSEAIESMPPQFLEKYPLLFVIRCYMLSILYRYRETDGLLTRFCTEHDRGEKTPPEWRSALGEAYMLWSHTGDILIPGREEVLRRYRRTAQLLPNGSAMIHAKINLFADRPVVHLSGPQAGSMSACLDFIRQVEPYANKITDGGWCGAHRLAEAEVQFYTRNFKGVEAPARSAVSQALEKKQYDIVCSAYYLLMRYNVAKGNYQQTVENLELLRQCAGEARYETFFSMPDLAESWLLLQLGRAHEVADWIRDESRYQMKILPWNYGRDRVIRSVYLLAMQQYDRVVAYTGHSMELFTGRGYILLNLNLRVVRAIALHCMGERAESVKELEEVYRWCRPNGIVMPIVEYGSYVRPLLENCRRVKSTVIGQEWLEDIGRKANTYATYIHNLRKEDRRKREMQYSILENLTTAEQRLLLQLCHGMTAREIAEQTGRSVGAVKGMSRRVYEKIGAGGKAEAVRIATECNIEALVKA